MCGQRLTCTFLLGALSLIVSAGKTPGLGVWSPPPAEFASSHSGVTSAGHVLYSSSPSGYELAPNEVRSPSAKGDEICG